MTDEAQAFMDACVLLSQRREALRVRGHLWPVELLDTLDALARWVYDHPLAGSIDCRRAGRVMRDIERCRRVASCGVTSTGTAPLPADSYVEQER